MTTPGLDYNTSDGRTHVIYETPDAGMPQARDVAALMAEKLGWDAAEQERQVVEYARQVALTRNWRKDC